MKKLGRAIMYLSDLYVMVMVLGWVFGIIFFAVCSIYAMINLSDTSIFSYLTELITVPATAGGSLWLIRCCVQHATADKPGTVDPDFPNQDAPEPPSDDVTQNQDNQGEL